MLVVITKNISIAMLAAVYSLVFCMACLCLENSLFAQSPRIGPRVLEIPSRPAISPYLNLGRGQSGELPSYQAFVLPNIQLQKQQRSLQQLQSQAFSLERAVNGDANVRSTGTGSAFQNFSHFYPVRGRK